MVHVEDRVRCTGCNKVFCKYCEERCPSCYGIHIAVSKPSLKYSQDNLAKPKHVLVKGIEQVRQAARIKIV
jgi:ferredoxin